MLQVSRGPDASTGSKLNGRKEVLSVICVLHMGRGRGFLFLAFIVVLFHSYHYAENSIPIIYSILCPLPHLKKMNKIFPHMKRRSAIFFTISRHLQQAEMQTVSHISMKIYKHHHPRYFKGQHTQRKRAIIQLLLCLPGTFYCNSPFPLPFLYLTRIML